MPLAGCGAVDGPATTDPLERTDYRLTNLSVWNEDSTAHSVDLVVLRDDEVVYWKTVDVDAGEGWKTSADAFDLPDGGEEPAPWTIHARYEGRTGGKTFTSAEMTGENGCIWPIVHIHEGGVMGLTEELGSIECS